MVLIISAVRVTAWDQRKSAIRYRGRNERSNRGQEEKRRFETRGEANKRERERERERREERREESRREKNKGC